MGHTLLCVLELFLLNTLVYGQTEAPRAILTVQPNSLQIFSGETITLRCEIKGGGDTKWTYDWFKDNSNIDPTLPSIEYIISSATQSHSGEYSCMGRSGSDYTQWSNRIKVTVSDGHVILEIPAVTLFEGDTVTLGCRHRTPRNDMRATFFKDEQVIEVHQNLPTPRTGDTRVEMFISSVAGWGSYKCKFDDWTESESSQLEVKSRRDVRLTEDETIRPLGGSVTLTCSVEEPTGFKYEWFRQTSDSAEKTSLQIQDINNLVTSHGGKYTCRGRRSDPDIFTPESNEVTIQQIVSNRATLTLQPNWPQIFSGETITLRCEIDGGGNTQWTYEWRPDKSTKLTTNNEYWTGRVTESDSGEYSCKGKKDRFTSTEWSNAIRLTVSRDRPKAELRADYELIPLEGSVTLTCSVSPSSSDWKYFWSRGEKTSEPLTTQDADFISTGQIRVSQGGLYWCRGGRGDSLYFTEYSDSIRINKKTANEAVVTLQPNWTEIYSGETITLRCEIKDGGDTEWEYEWKTTSSDKPTNHNEHRIRSARVSHSGDYRCKGKMKSETFSTDWSDPIKLTVSWNQPKPVLTVSPSWLSPGDSVTLNCEVQHPSAGWRFFWYKAVPKLSDYSYSYELLSASSNGTEQDSYIVHGQKQTAQYRCRAGRGDPVYYTRFSEPKFVWSGDFPSSASLTVSPDSVQHFTSDSVSLHCEGNSTEWRVRRFPEYGYQSDCRNWGTMTGSTCKINSYQQRDYVYWCESGSGEFSNTVNITIQNNNIILVSPVHPVTEGESVSLSCKMRWHQFVSNVFFYQNGELIQNDTRSELNISSVSKSDEGFYKCQYSGKMSAESWMSVKAESRPESSSSPVPLIVMLVCGVVLIILLLLLCRYRPSKNSCCIRSVQSESTNQDSSPNHVVNQSEAECNYYSSTVDGGAPLYESVKSSERTENDANDSQDVTYSLLELRKMGRKGRKHAAEESSVYSEVKTRSADDNLLYAQVNHPNKGKAKNNKGRSPPAATDETLYSEVKPGASQGL